MKNTACTIKIKNFEGPFDLLFHLIEKNKMNIYDISIDEIADQYMEYLFAMQEMDLEIASEFLVMASTLLHIKSRALIPVKAKIDDEEKEELDPREELILKLIEYKKYKEFTSELKKREEEWNGAYFKGSEPIKFKWELPPLKLSSEKLKEVYAQLLLKYRLRSNQDVDKKMTNILEHEKVSLSEKMKDIARCLINKAFIKFSDIFSIKNKSRPEVVTGFLAILELAKLKRVEIVQNKSFEEILIVKKELKKEIKSNDEEFYNEAQIRYN